MKKLSKVLLVLLAISLFITSVGFASEVAEEDRIKVGISMYNLAQGGDLDYAVYSKQQVFDTLDQIAALGFDGIEWVNLSWGIQFYGVEPTELRAYMDKIGLESIDTHYHANWLSTPEDIEKVVEANYQLGCPRITFAWSSANEGETNEEWLARIDQIIANVQAEIDRKGYTDDLRIIYHNHSQEFVPVSETDSTYVMNKINAVEYQADMYWASRAFGDVDKAIEWLQNDVAGKVTIFHIKDGTYVGDTVIMPWGKGEFDIQKIIDGAKAVDSIEWVIVECDTPYAYNNNNGIQDATISMNYLKENLDLSK